MDRLTEELYIFLSMGLWFCILPSLLIGIGMWDKKNRKYKYLLCGSDRYIPVSGRPWKKGELRQIYGLGILMIASAAIVAFASVTLLISSVTFSMSGTDSVGYMFIFSSAFLCFLLIYWIFHTFYFRRHDGPLYIHLWAKAAAGLIWLAMSGSVLWYNGG